MDKKPIMPIQEIIDIVKSVKLICIRLDYYYGYFNDVFWEKRIARGFGSLHVRYTIETE